MSNPITTHPLLAQTLENLRAAHAHTGTPPAAAVWLSPDHRAIARLLREHNAPADCVIAIAEFLALKYRTFDMLEFKRLGTEGERTA